MINDISKSKIPVPYTTFFFSYDSDSAYLMFHKTNHMSPSL